MVNIPNMKTKRPFRKLDHKPLGPVRIVEVVGKRAFRVELPYEAKNHPVFHVAELELYRQSNIDGRKQPPRLSKRSKVRQITYLSPLAKTY